MTGIIHVNVEPVVVEPGAPARIRFELNKPVAIEHGMRFAMREGGKPVGACIVAEVLGCRLMQSLPVSIVCEAAGALFGCDR